MSSQKRCPICSSARVASVTERQNVPVHQNMLFASPEAARLAVRGDLSVVACLDCDFVFNASFDHALMSYGAGYESDQTYSPAFNSHVADLLSALLNDKGVRDSCIVEVGCGKGDFLRSLVRPEQFKNTGWGFDPSYTGIASDLDGRLNYVQGFYSEEHAKITADVVVIRHVMEHVPDPLTLLCQIRLGSIGARIYMETKDVSWVLENAVLWDFFYEYCSYFSPRSLARAFQMVGLDYVEIEHVFGGQYLWVEAPATACSSRELPIAIEQSVMTYVRRESEMRVRWADTIEEIGKQGAIALWGAGAKGGTFASLFDPDAQKLSCVVDLNPAKQGKFIAGSGHPILAPSHLTQRGIRNVIVMNPNYVPEVRELLARESIEANIVVGPEVPHAVRIF